MARRVLGSTGTTARTRRRRAASTSRAPVTVSISVGPRPRVELTEEPRSHIVCRGCGRIQSIELTELERHLLTELAGRRPDGWNVERVAFSLMGACRRCREGPTA